MHWRKSVQLINELGLLSGAGSRLHNFQVTSYLLSFPALVVATISLIDELATGS